MDEREGEVNLVPGRTEVTKASDREVVVRRSFEAPVRLMFEAWTTPELFVRWWIPRSTGMTLRSYEMDVRTGGRYRLSFGEGLDFYGRYLEVTPSSRIVWTNEEGGDDGSVTTVTFTEEGTRTVVVISEVFPTTEALDAEGGSAEAMPETLAQLEEVLAELASRS